MPIPTKEFEKGTEPVAGQRSTQNHKGKVSKWMQENAVEEAHTQKEIADALGYEESRTVRNPLLALEKVKKVERKEVPTTKDGKSRDLQYWRWIGGEEEEEKTPTE